MKSILKHLTDCIPALIVGAAIGGGVTYYACISLCPCSLPDYDCISKIDGVSFTDSSPEALIERYKDWADTSKISSVRALNIPRDVINSMFLFVNYPPTSTDEIRGIRVYYGATSDITGTPSAANTRMILWPMGSGGDIIADFPSSDLRILTVPGKYELPCPRFCD